MKATKSVLLQIIQEEAAKALQERLDHAGIRDVVNASSRCLAALEAFDGSATGPLKNATIKPLKELIKVLEDAIGNPQSYLEAPKKDIMAKKPNPDSGKGGVEKLV